MEELKAKVGDKLLYTHLLRGSKSEKIVEVVKVTPTGRIRIYKDNSQYDKFGVKIGNKDVWSGYTYLKKLTEEDCIRIKKNIIIKKAKNILQNIRLEDITYEKALKIIEIFGEKETR